MNIYFDMDGTIADLYGVENWLEDLLHEDIRPYREAKPLVNFNSFARLLNRLINNGNKIYIISWTCRGGSVEYNDAITMAKIKWLKKHLPSVNFTAIYIVPYGTPKNLYGNGILFDDEERNRTQWGENAFTEKDIFQVLRSLL